MKLEILEHESSSYAPRTAVNAKVADATLAFAVDYNSAGERLTKRMAGEHYLAVPLSRDQGDVLVQARRVFRFVRAGNYRALNIAGNSIATLSSLGWTQADVNEFVWRVLKQVHAHWPFVCLRSGGQTGADVAGAVAAVALSVPATVLFPKGLLQRTSDGVDVLRTRDFVEQQIVRGAEQLLALQQREA
jgi:Circularly permutated YpsA SLOG family